jgi:polyhydroxyalkanoate synthesis regulator phasin
MANNERLRKYVEAGAVLGHVTRARAEEIVRELVSSGDVQRGQAQQWVDDILERSRKASEDLIHLVRTEVSNQLAALGVDPEDLAKQVADILKHSAGVGRKATSSATSTAGTTVGKTASAAKKAAARATGARLGAKKAAAKVKKSPAKKATAKTTAPKKSAAKKATGAKSAAKKATGKSSGPAN